jgi:transposase
MRVERTDAPARRRGVRPGTPSLRAKRPRNAELVRRYEAGARIADLAAAFAISRARVHEILRRETHLRGHVPLSAAERAQRSAQSKAYHVARRARLLAGRAPAQGRLTPLTRAAAAGSVDERDVAAVAAVEAGMSYGAAARAHGRTRNQVAGAVHRARRRLEAGL